MKSIKTTRLCLLLFWVISLSLMSTQAFAQMAKISGSVINERTLVPLPGATIKVKNTNRMTAADAAGKFTIEAVAGDVLIITRTGYLPREVVVGKNNTVMNSYRLQMM